MNAPRSIVSLGPGYAVSSSRTLQVWLGVSAMLHLAAAATFIVARSGEHVDRPPSYRVQLVGAAGMKRQMGVVADQPPVETPGPKAAAPAAAERIIEPPKVAPPKSKAKPLPQPKQATPNVAKSATANTKTATKPAEKAAPPVAGSGNKTGKGTDVTNMVSDGIDFPYPVYLNRIATQIKLNFQVPAAGTSLVAEVKFLIHRDGSVTDIQITQRSGSSAFDREATGSIEAAGTSRAFGPLPAGFPNDVLPVYFTFSPEKPPA